MGPPRNAMAIEEAFYSEFQRMFFQEFVMVMLLGPWRISGNLDIANPM
jgi:hypothetical protein